MASQIGNRITSNALRPLPNYWHRVQNTFRIKYVSVILGLLSPWDRTATDLRPQREKAFEKEIVNMWKYGLHMHDIPPESEFTKKAFSMMPLKELELRDRRIKRAAVLWASKTELPEEERPNSATDFPYLTQYMHHAFEDYHDRRTFRHF